MNEVKPSKNVKVILPNKVEVLLEATPLGGEERIGAKLPDFKPVIDALQGIAQAVKTASDPLGPSKTSVELGLDIAVESGQLIAFIVKGSAKANLKVSLQWGN